MLMDEKNKHSNDKVSRIEDFTSHQREENDNDDLGLFRRNKDFRNRKRKRFGDKVNEEELANHEHQREDDTQDKHLEQNVENSSNQDSPHDALDKSNDTKQDETIDVDSDDNLNESQAHNDNLEEKNETDQQEDKEASSDSDNELKSTEDNAQDKKEDKKKGLLGSLPFINKNKRSSGNKDQQVEPNRPMTLEEKRALRRQRQKRIQYTIITLLVLLIVIFLLYMFTPLSKISNVNVKGNNNVSTSKINKELHVTSHTRMYTFSKRKAINNLKKNPLIKDVEIHKQLPNTLNVKVTEYQVVGLEKNKDNYVPIIEDGKELKDYSDDVSHDGPIIDGFKGNKKTSMIKALSEMSPEVRSMIAEVSYAPAKNKQNRIKIFTKDDIQVVGDITTIANKMKYYPQMSQSLSRDDSGNLKTDGYIDLSVGASFIPYGGSSGAESETDQNVTKSTQQESEAKEELQSVLNKINKQSKDNN